MPSDKRDSAKKSDRASGSGSSSRPSATVTSDAVPAVPSTSAGAEVSTASAKEGTVRSSSTSSAKRTSRTGAHVTSKHSAQALSSAPFDTQASFTDMPTLTSDVCDDMFSDEDVSGADRAPLRSPPALFPASRERRQRVCRQARGGIRNLLLGLTRSSRTSPTLPWQRPAGEQQVLVLVTHQRLVCPRLPCHSTWPRMG